jgi:hypothetical protein
MKRYLLTLFLFCSALWVAAQENRDSLNVKVNRISKVLQALREFRIVVYAQVQFQKADTLGARSFAGGDFPAQSDNRFMIRRGRVKISYDHEGKKGFRIFQSTFQMDVTERGFQLRDFYGRIIDPFTGWIGLQTGFMDRPFGYEVTTADDTRESPERSRLSQTIFPGEKDLGASLVIESPKTFKPLYLRIDGGVFNGTGAVSSFTKAKDFIGRLQLRKPFKVNASSNFTVSGGASYYNGRVLQSTPLIYKLANDANGILRYTPLIDSASVDKKFYKREYYGVDLQAGIDYALGATTVRGEFIAGKEPGISNALNVPLTLGSDLYLRQFNGGTFYFVQTFKHKIKDHVVYHDFVFKYDFFNPNSRIAQKDLSSMNDSHVSAADIGYQTFGVGYTFRPFEFFQLQVYYDIVKNNATQVNNFTRDLKDNVLTVRTQFKFDTNWFSR